jgi:hypothetical protein
MLDKSDPEDLFAGLHTRKNEIEAIYRQMRDESEGQRRGLVGGFQGRQQSGKVAPLFPSRLVKGGKKRRGRQACQTRSV